MPDYSTLLQISQVLPLGSEAAVASFVNFDCALNYLWQQNTDQVQLELITNDNVWYWIVPASAASKLSWVGFRRLVTLECA